MLTRRALGRLSTPLSRVSTATIPRACAYSTATLTREKVTDWTTPLSEPEMAAIAQRHLTKGLARMSDHVVEKAQGVWIHTVDGKTLLDFTSGIGATSTGHCHPSIVSAVTAQSNSIAHAQMGIVLHKPLVDTVRKLLAIMPDPSLDTFFFRTTGSEAIEEAVKVARISTGRQNIIAFQGGFHGRTIGTLSLTTSKNVYRANFGPLMPGVVMAPHPYRSFCRPGACPESPLKSGDSVSTCSPDTCTACAEPALEQFELLLKTVTSPSEVAAVIIEPVLGEGGYVPASNAFLRGLREITKRHGILLVADEVQCGMGRTGTTFAFEHAGIVPDIVVFAKGVASGYPLSGIVSTKAVLDACAPGSMGGTYIGNPVAMAAAAATLEVFQTEKVFDNAVARGEQIVKLLNAELPRIVEGKDIKVDVRGRGLMIGVEFYGEGVEKMKKEGKSLSAEVQKAALKKDLLILTTSVYESIRIVPALTISEAESADGIGRFLQSIEEVLA
ncbi:acetylornithine aminotransferase [Gonapodya prolifera JEL478]|uniref:Acetylornithine aminotransferase n=1 Tax=Gonapodya prolifera (strain JEL478) TaxID=1344416 RepID=A0A139AF32_GONPJ|nr:acetylornithine aminotransferase [Gonapodya prolifera JEL478]|eukprot:KXS15360.1 acetylornithine aminotransferase [Gonapodya prolifera JEL478]